MKGCRLPCLPNAALAFPDAPIPPTSSLPTRTATPQKPQKRGKPDLKVPGPKLPRQTGAAWDERFNAWTFPFMGGSLGGAGRAAAGKKSIPIPFKSDPSVPACTSCLCCPGADASVVRRTMARVGPPANVSIVFTLPSRMYMMLWQASGGVLWSVL